MWSNAAFWYRVAPLTGHAEEQGLVMDEARFKAFYQQTSRPLWGYLYRLCGKPALADDILQDAYCRFLQADLKEAELPQLRSYLYRIASNLLTDHYRKTGRESSLEERPERVAPDSDLADTTMRRTDLQRALLQVSPNERVMLWMAYVEGSAHREIARRLGLKEKSIKVLLFRARRKLAETLKEMGVESTADFFAPGSTNRSRP
ncbi:MAG TPA: RNA polymerase sigma factor [Acidobacteriota bacterium]|nr:RNA polymerase sigma factor [Acidobacteriota bacterium]